jgi:hypothetical protein
MDKNNIDEYISAFYDGELNPKETDELLNKVDSDRYLKDKFYRYGILSAAINLETNNIESINAKTKTQYFNMNLISHGLTAAATVLLTIFIINDPQISRMGVDKNSKSLLNNAIDSSFQELKNDSNEDLLVNHVISFISDSSRLNVNSSYPDLKNVGYSLEDNRKRFYSNGQENFVLHIEKKEIGINKIRYWKHNDKNIFLIPLSNGRLLTLYGNISLKSAVMIARTIK